MKLIMSATELDAVLREADEPSREIDDRIWRWANERGLFGGWRYDLVEAPEYTKSVDAALTLLPVMDEHGTPMDFILEHVNGGLTIGCRVGVADPDSAVFGCNDASAIARAAIIAHMRLI